MLLIGSRALRAHCSDFGANPKSDYDFIATQAEIDAWVALNNPANISTMKGIVRATDHYGHKFEIEIAEPESSADDLLKLAGPELDASLEMLALIKRSHLHKEINWQKHIAGYHFIRTKAWPDKYGTPLVDLLSPELVPVYHKRVKETNERWPAREPKLDVTNEQFFGKKTPYVHDDIHRTIAYYHAPLFEMCKKDKSKAWVEIDMFKQLSHDDQVKMVREEAYTIALERFVIPAMRSGQEYNTNTAFDDAVKFVCTRLFRDFWRDFAIEHWPEVNRRDVDFVKVFLRAITTGKLKLIGE